MFAKPGDFIVLVQCIQLIKSCFFEFVSLHYQTLTIWYHSFYSNQYLELSICHCLCLPAQDVRLIGDNVSILETKRGRGGGEGWLNSTTNINTCSATNHSPSTFEHLICHIQPLHSFYSYKVFPHLHLQLVECKSQRLLVHVH